MDKPITYFISGHIDLSKEEFDKFYKNEILLAVNNPNSKFVMGNAPGVDYMAQKLLIELFDNDDKKLDRICVYHRDDNPGKIADPRIKTIGGFKSHDDKDRAMTMNSDIDIAYVRSIEESKILYGDKYNPNRISGTQKNLLRRLSKQHIN